MPDPSPSIELLHAAAIAQAEATLHILKPSALAANNPPPCPPPGDPLPFPSAQFTANAAPDAPLHWFFHDASQNGGRHKWFFGDGTSSDTEGLGEFQNPSHVYAAPGQYYVTLIISNPEGRMSAATYLITVLASGGTLLPTNTVPPLAEPASPVIGDAMTYTPGEWDDAASIEFERWEQSADGVTWTSAAADMPNDDSAPTASQFGRRLRGAETATRDAGGSKTVYSDPTGYVASLHDDQSLGSETVSNGTMETGSPPTGWAANGTGASISSQSDERTGGAGTKALRVTGGAGTNPNGRQTTAQIAAEKFVVQAGWVRNVDTSSGVFLRFGSTTIVSTIGTSWVAGQRIMYNPAAQTPIVQLLLSGSQNTKHGHVDDVSQKEIVANTQRTAPSATMRLDFFYTLPGSPVEGTQVWLLPRIDNTELASGNFYAVRVLYTGGQWNVDVQDVTGGALSPLSGPGATNVGATDGVRVNLNGTAITVYTTANSGGAWTQRGTAGTALSRTSATGANAVHTPDVTGGQLVYAPAD